MCVISGISKRIALSDIAKAEIFFINDYLV